MCVRRCFIEFKVSELDIESALDIAAAHSSLPVVEFLVNMGAKNLDGALLSAVVKDDAQIVGYLISHERRYRAKNVKNAQLLAAKLGSISAEWVLLSENTCL